MRKINQKIPTSHEAKQMEGQIIFDAEKGKHVGMLEFKGRRIIKEAVQVMLREESN